MNPSSFIRRSSCRVAMAIALVLVASLRLTAAPLISLEYRLVGTHLRVTPEVLSVPKGIAGSILVELVGASNAVPSGAFVEATLRGPSFPARILIGQVNAPLLLPSLSLTGDYQLDSIRVVRQEGANKAVLLEGSPSSVPVRVFDEVLISRVTSRPLTLEEIQERGIVIDERNFRTVEFEVGFVLDGKIIPVRFPVVAPAFQQATEIIPESELQARLSKAEDLNRELAATVAFPKELETARVNIDVRPINFQLVDLVEKDLFLQIPPIPALMIVPGNIGFLHQFFSVQIFTENAAPNGSGLSVFDVKAELKLPSGPDLLLSTNYNQPGDDPLRFARVGPDKIIEPVQPVVRPGSDGKTGTADDIPRLFPGDVGQGEFLVEGLQEGLHVMDLALTANLDGLVAGTVKIQGKAAGSVLVRNPRFSMAFSHPRTVRFGELYDAYVTILNTGLSVANLVQVTLNSASISGGELQSAETVVLGTILPGQTATAKFTIRALRTGAVSFSNLTTSDDSVIGRFRLRAGVDERGVVLSPDTLALPDFVTNLPPAVVNAAHRVLGQALSIATAGQLPAGVKALGKSIVTRRALELAEAGQRVQYGEEKAKVLADLLLDWQGGRESNAAFDQIIFETNAGREWREALAAGLDAVDATNTAPVRLTARLPDLAGRGEAWTIFALDAEAGTVLFGDGVAGAIPAVNTNKLVAQYDNTNSLSGQWFVAHPSAELVLEWNLAQSVPLAQLALANIATNGTAQILRWTLSNLVAGACVRFSQADPAALLLVDNDCNGLPELTLSPASSIVNERPPEVLALRQEPGVLAGRPSKPCFPSVPSFPNNYGTVLAVLFSKPMTQERVNLPSAYVLDNGNVAASVQIQPGGRVALLNMRRPTGALRARTISVTGVTDLRGHPVPPSALALQSSLRSGVALRGRVARSDGSPAAGVPVTLTYYDLESSGFGECPPLIARASQVFTGEGGYFDFDYVLSGIPYSVSATDTTGLTPETIALILESARGDEFARDKLLELARSTSVQNTLLAEFATGALPEAIARAEGLDRALIRDFVPVGSPREGTEVPMALRFRGRGTVSGQVVAADGFTPMSRVAINLFPDPDSRELGRGVFTDESGRFAFFGVPLGTFTLKADSGTGLTRTLAGLLATPGATTNMLVVLSSVQVVRTDLVGQVLETDQTTPHALGAVFIGHLAEGGAFKDVVAAVTADSSGFWRASGIPVGTYDVVALSFDGRRKGERRDIAAPAGLTNFVHIALQGFGVVIGRVETATGAAIINAIVGGGEQLVRTTNNGFFRLTGVPTGRRTISAGVERTTNALAPKSTPAFPFPRLGSAEVNVVPGVENFVLIRFDARGSVIGRVVDETGTNVMTNLNVALPEQNGFQWVPVNSRGEFVFEGLPLKEHIFSAPAPAVFETDVGGVLRTLHNSDSSTDEIQAAIGEAFAIFTGAADPLLNGSGDNFNPNRWGFTETTLSVDREVKNITIQFLRAATIAGTVLNGQGVPIGARLRLTGIGPAANGAPSTIIRGERNSDAALGTFVFDRQAFVGSFGLQAASPFFPMVLTTNGFTSEVQPFETNVVLQFPSERDINGRIAGFVFDPDGSLADPGVKVRIRSLDLEIETGTNGFFDTQISFPAADYFIECEDLNSGALGAATLRVLAGVTNQVNIRLLGRGALFVTVLKNDGTPASGARIDLEQANFPRQREQRFAGANGQVLVANLFEGTYAVCAQFTSGQTTLGGRVPATISLMATQNVIIRLGPTATIEGFFVRRDFVTPIGFAQIAVGNVGFATTRSNGFFSVGGLPLGSYRLVSHDPVTGAGAVLNATLNFDGQTNRVTLVEQSRGEVRGAVIDSDGTNVVAGVHVTLHLFDGITPDRTSTTGPDGRFNFPGVPAGPFELQARHPLTGIQGKNTGTLPDGAEFLDINVALEPLAAWTIVVLRPDGVTPATTVTVSLDKNGVRSADTDALGRASFSGLSLLHYTLTATSRVFAETRSVARTDIALTAPGQAAELTLRLAGVGRVNGRVFQSDGLTPAVNATVTLTHQGPVFLDQISTFTDGAGNFTLSNVAVGPYLLNVRGGVLGARVGGTIAVDGEVDVLSLTLESSGSVRGRLVRADRVTAVAGEDVKIIFPGRNLPGEIVRTGSNGVFQFDSVPLGTFQLQCLAIGFNGIALANGTLASNGQTNNVGDLIMDEDDPRVVSALPPDTSTGISITTVVDLEFNEALAVNSVNATGVYLQGPSNTVASTVQLLSDSNGVPRRVRVTPTTPLRSLTTYRVVVVDGERLNAFGAVIGSGPTDLVGRPLIAPFLSTFTTADNTPPQLASIFPTNGQIQIDPRAVMRLSFNEPVRASVFVVTLSGPGGVVPGIGSVGLNGLVLAFAPLEALPPNGTFTLTVSNIFDLAGNRALGEPFTGTFDTLDLLGPEIGGLTILSGKSPVAGATVPIAATLALDEAGASVHFFKDGAPVGSDFTPPFHADVTLPTNGATTISAFAVDRLGNHGTNATLVVNVVPNQPPTVSLTRVVPLNGPIASGQSFTLAVGATDDLDVSRIDLLATGVFTFATNLPGLATQTLAIVVPASAISGPLQIRAQATDQLGATSAVATVAIDIRDGTVPAVAILSPPSDFLLEPTQALALDLVTSDNSTNHQIEVTLSGALLATQSISVATVPNTPVTNRFTFSLAGLPANGATITANIRATDGATNVGLASRRFRLPGSTLAISAPAQFSIQEGNLGTLLVSASSDQPAIVLLDYSNTNPPPLFVSVKSRSFTNVPSGGGTAAMELEFNPLHDAAGTHALQLRAQAADGAATTFTIQLVVTDNPSLSLTRWKDPVNGNWSDAGKWTAGLPSPGKVAVIDVAGSYTVNLDGSATASGIVLDQTNGVLQLTASAVLTAPFELRAGQFAINGSRTLTLNAPLANRGVMRGISAFNSFTLQGSGRVENEGLWEIFKDPTGSSSGESDVRVPVNVRARAGKLLISTNGRVNFGVGSSLQVAGELEIQSGARLRLDGSNPARDLSLLAGSSVNGMGTIQLDGGCRMLTAGDLDTTVAVVLNGAASSLIVPGTYTVHSSRTQTGTVQADAVAVLGNTVLSVNSAAFIGKVIVESGALVRGTGNTITFGSNVLVQAGGRLDMEVGSPTVTLNGVLLNRGAMQWISAFNAFTLQGSGRVENEGLWEIFKDPNGSSGSGDANVHLPVHVPPGGKLLISTNGGVNFGEGSSLTIAGELEVQSGARLRLDSSTPARDLTLLSGSALNGAGAIQLEGSCRMLTPGDLDTTATVVLNSATTQLIVPGTYTVRNSRTQIGSVQAGAVVVMNSAVLTLNNAGLTGVLIVESGALVRGTGNTITFGSNVLVQAGGRLDMEVASPVVNLNGVLTNRGAMQWISAFNAFTLQGSGRVENEGLWEIFKDPNGFSPSSDSDVRLPVHVPVGAKLLLSTNAQLNLSAGSSLAVEGQLEVQTGALLRVENSSPPRDLTVSSTASLTGAGVIRFEGSNRLVLLGNATIGVGLLELAASSSSILGTGTLTVAAGAKLQIGHSTSFGGSIVVSGTLTNESGSTFTISFPLLG